MPGSTLGCWTHGPGFALSLFLLSSIRGAVPVVLCNHKLLFPLQAPWILLMLPSSRAIPAPQGWHLALPGVPRGGFGGLCSIAAGAQPCSPPLVHNHGWIVNECTAAWGGPGALRPRVPGSGSGPGWAARPPRCGCCWTWTGSWPTSRARCCGGSATASRWSRAWSWRSAAASRCGSSTAACGRTWRWVPAACPSWETLKNLVLPAKYGAF